MSQTYTGSAITPCSVTVTGAGGLSLTPAPVYGDNVDAGMASASYSYAGDTNHAVSSDSKTFTIDPASSTTTVTCPASQTHTGSALEPCTASYSGAGGLTGTLTPTYTNNVNVGTATADASYAGDVNHTSSSGSATFEIVSVPTYSVSGYVSDNLGAALTGVLVQNGSNSDITVALGYYSITGLVNGVYNFSYSKSGFNTGYLELTISGANIENANKTILDNTAPDTIIDSAPPVSSSSSSASFTFHSTEAGSTFQCQLDSGSYSSCSSPADYSVLSAGNHTFDVTAIDAMGNADSTPASFTWTIDSIAPSSITNLAAGSPTANTITLTWTAPGDDGITGTASQYDIRYSLLPIDISNWDSAIQVTGEPSPQAFNHLETFIVSGLSPSKLYHFAIKTGDELPNWSGLSNMAGATTTTLPSVRYINGTVTSSAEPHNPLAGVTVKTGSLTAMTDSNGKYSFAVVSGSYPLTATYDIRYYTGSLTVSSEFVVESNGNIELQLKPTGTISGTVSVGV